jgi:ABC-type branched-subunit amino acid transport system substrate-binding protein
MRIGLELWAQRVGARLVLADDGSEPARSVECFRALLARGCRLVLPPYGGDSTRAVAAAHPGAVVWNHGAAADDVQRLLGVVSLPTRAGRYLVALGRAVAELRPGAAVAVVAGGGAFGRFAGDAFVRAAEGLGLRLAGRLGFADPPARIAASSPDAVFACGPAQREVELFRTLASLLPDVLRGGASPGLAAFPELLGGDPEGFLAPVQWHQDVAIAPELGPSSAEVVAEARASAHTELDYVAAQAYAAALVAERCLALDPDDPLSAARSLRTMTFFGAFELAPESGVQRGHRLAVIEWRGGQREVLLADAS